MHRTAVLICEDIQEQEQRLTKILDFFGVSWESAGPDALWGSRATPQNDSSDGYCVFASMALLGKVLEFRRGATDLPHLLNRAHSVYLYGSDDRIPTELVVRWLTNCPSARIVPIQQNEPLCSVSNRRADVCGPMTGLHVRVTTRACDSAIKIAHSGREIEALISTNEGHIFACVNCDGIPCFLDACSCLIDIARPVTKGFFDVRDYFSSAVPLVMYLRFAFPDTISAPAENGACLIVDDPTLRPQYGFLNYERIVALAREHTFTCSIAFIPLNWRRSQSSVIELFKQHSEILSLCIHGCDHTSREFGTSSIEALNAKAKLAMCRMQRHQQLTGLRYAPLMVFPQGIFSTEAPAALKHNGFIAAINTEVSPVNWPTRTEIRETWKMALMDHADFAIYTRRYISHGLCNFAFDLLLRKPILIVTHCADFHHDCRELMEFIDHLNGLKASLTWRPLEDVIRRAYHQRLRNDGLLQITAFGNEVILENPSSESRQVLIEKQEHLNHGGIAHVEVAGRSVEFINDHGRLRLEFDLLPHKCVLVRIVFQDIYGPALSKRTHTERAKILVRRYLSEFRDEAGARSPWILALATKARNWLHAINQTAGS